MRGLLHVKETDKNVMQKILITFSKSVIVAACALRRTQKMNSQKTYNSNLDKWSKRARSTREYKFFKLNDILALLEVFFSFFGSYVIIWLSSKIKKSSTFKNLVFPSEERKVSEINQRVILLGQGVDSLFLPVTYH